jgi:hypothetical protein
MNSLSNIPIKLILKFLSQSSLFFALLIFELIKFLI